jgi:hypothetical protein
MKSSVFVRSVYIGSTFLLILSLAILPGSCRSSRLASENSRVDTLMTHSGETGIEMVFHFSKGESFNHPLMALWVEDTGGTYLQTLYVAESIAKGVFGHGDPSSGKWMPGPLRRPAALPVWSFSRGVREDDGFYIPTINTPLPDAYTGATPSGNFVVISRLPGEFPGVFDLYFEINQTWDWNEYWTNNKYPDDEDYKTSCQPALVYRARIETTLSGSEFELKLIGHGHYSGDNGEIYSDLTTITTARNITARAWAELR